jgi:uncharacterized protein involved in exopolysaccharide biosynthesis
MELTDLLRVVRRWLWLIIAVVVVTELALWLGMRSAEPVYAATVKLQLSTPQREEVSAFDQYASISLRDEITVAINNFIDLVQSDEVYKRTISQLGLEGKDALYTVAAARATDADFVTVTVQARTPSLAADIANAHVATAISYYGELRAQSTKADENLFIEQLRIAEKDFRDAESALSDFRTKNGIYSLESQMSTQQKLLEQLQLEHDQAVLNQSATAIATNATATATPVITTKKKGVPVDTPVATPVIDPVGEVDKLIAQRLKELEQLTALTPQYNILAQNVEQARTAYQHLLAKYSEAELKISAVQAANFIPVIKPAYTPVGSESSWPKLALLALAGSLGLGVVLAFLLEYLTGFKAASVTVPVSDHKTPSDESASLLSLTGPVAEQEPITVQGQQGSTLEAASATDPVSDQKTPSDESASLVSPTGPVAEQEPIAVQDQQDSTFEAASLHVPVSDDKTPSDERANLVSPTEPVAEQEPTALQDQQGATFEAASVPVPVSDDKKPSRGKRSSRKTRSTDSE